MSAWGDALFLIAAPVAFAACVALTCGAAHVSGAMPGADLRLPIGPQRIAEQADDTGIDRAVMSPGLSDPPAA